MKRIKGKNDQGRRDGLRTASSISPGLSRRRFTLSDPPRGSRGSTLPCLLLSGTRIRCGTRAPLQRVHAHVCSCCTIREMKFKQYTADPRRRVGSEIAYNNVFKIYSLNRYWIRSNQRTLILASSPRESSRHARWYLRYFTREQAGKLGYLMNIWSLQSQ